MGDVEDKIMSFSETNITKDYSKSRYVQNLYDGGKKPRKLKTRKQSEEKIIKTPRNLFKLKNKNETIKDNN